MKKNKLSHFEAVCFVLICMINEIILNVAQNFVISVGTGSLINLILVSFIAFIFCIIISKLFKNFSNSNLIEISEFLGGKILKFITGFIFILFFIMLACFSISNFSYLIKTIYFQKSPILFIGLFFATSMLISNLIGFDSLKKVACLTVPFCIISIFFVFIASLKNYTPYRLTPIFGYNLKSTFIYGLTNLYGFSIIIYYYFLMPFLRNKQKYFKIIKHSFFISFIILLLIIISMLSNFPSFDNSEEINSMYLLTRSIELTDFLQRVDALFILLWIISNFVYISILLFWTLEIFGNLFNFENKKILSFPLSCIVLGLVIFIYNNLLTEFIKTDIYKYLFITIIFGISFLILCFANIKKKLKKKN